MRFKLVVYACSCLAATAARRQALQAAHFWTIYLLFPLWYLLFAAVYFRAAAASADAGAGGRTG